MQPVQENNFKLADHNWHNILIDDQDIVFSKLYLNDPEWQRLQKHSDKSKTKCFPLSELESAIYFEQKNEILFKLAKREEEKSFETFAEFENKTEAERLIGLLNNKGGFTKIRYMEGPLRPVLFNSFYLLLIFAFCYNVYSSADHLEQIAGNSAGSPPVRFSPLGVFKIGGGGARLISGLAETMGTTGTLITGGLATSILIFFLINRLKKPAVITKLERV